jgi:hypothetical protein
LREESVVLRDEFDVEGRKPHVDQELAFGYWVAHRLGRSLRLVVQDRNEIKREEVCGAHV